jgi:hypothetical protein
MYDLERTNFSERFERPVLTGTVITDEGQILVLCDDGEGNAAVRTAQGIPDEVPLGFALTDNEKKTTDTSVENFSIPAAAPYTLQLPYRTITGSAGAFNLTVYDITAATYLHQVLGVPGAGDFECSPSGLLTFNVAEKGHELTVVYEYLLTADQIAMKYHQQPVTFNAQDHFGSVGVGGGYGVIFTTLYDPTALTAGGDGWPTIIAGQQLYLGDKGKFVLQGPGTAFGKVIHRPSEDNPYLGVEFQVVL